MAESISGFEKRLEEFCLHSLDERSRPQVYGNPEYRQYLAETETLFSHIESVLGEKKDLIDEYDSLKNLAASYADVPTYLQGFRDCILFLRKLEFL